MAALVRRLRGLLSSSATRREARRADVNFDSDRVNYSQLPESNAVPIVSELPVVLSLHVTSYGAPPLTAARAWGHVCAWLLRSTIKRVQTVSMIAPLGC